MKRIQSYAAMALLSAAMHGHAAITVPSADGSDGVLNITADTVIDLSQAATGVWSNNNAANAGKGIYDPAKWAVVFKYSSVTVAAGKTLTFTNHLSRAPVVWLVSGNVTIDGTVSLSGAGGGLGVTLAEPGPGGFRGGQAWYTVGVGAAAGFGVGGGGGGVDNYGYGGSYGTAGGAGPTAYGNPSLIPLIGGSGGGGGSRQGEQLAGGGGGGAILIACTNTLTLSGSIQANGGVGRAPNYQAGGGSGGGIRLVADTLAGSGAVSTLGTTNVYPGGLGRIRIERVNNTNTITVTPDPSIVPLAPAGTALLWPPAGAPEVKIVSIGGQPIGADPLASFGTAGADAALPETASTQVIIETTNVEQASQVKVRGTPRSSGNFTEVAASVSSVVSTTPLVVRWTATLPVQVGFSAVQVKVIRP